MIKEFTILIAVIINFLTIFSNNKKVSVLWASFFGPPGIYVFMYLYVNIYIYIYIYIFTLSPFEMMIWKGKKRKTLS